MRRSCSTYRPLIEQIEQRIPRVIGSVDKETRKQVMSSPKVWVAAELTRTPFEFTFKDNTVTVSTSFEYRANAWAKPLLITHHVSCGMGKERPRLNLTVSTTYDLTLQLAPEDEDTPRQVRSPHDH